MIKNCFKLKYQFSIVSTGYFIILKDNISKQHQATSYRAW